MREPSPKRSLPAHRQVRQLPAQVFSVTWHKLSRVADVVAGVDLLGPLTRPGSHECTSRPVLGLDEPVATAWATALDAFSRSRGREVVFPVVGQTKKVLGRTD